MRIMSYLLVLGTVIALASRAQAAIITDLDSDDDGLSDRLEKLFGTNSHLADTDHDGFSDGKEVIAGFSPTTTLPTKLTKSLRISLKTQRLEQRMDDVAIASFPISAGLPRTPTPTGTFQILNKNHRAWSKMAKLWMPYWMSFSGRGHGIHELPEWPGGKKEGANHLGKPASHGCVRLGVGVAKVIYQWTPLGTRVVVTKD